MQLDLYALFVHYDVSAICIDVVSSHKLFAHNAMNAFGIHVDVMRGHKL